MDSVYFIRDDGVSEAMKQVRCQNEDRELQQILEKNPDLLPGDQIDPEDPCRWLLIKREMPVPDPNTGISRWSVDFLFTDQNAVPTFVECKRFADTRSRREVIGQMFEYAANGPYYWTKEDLRAFAEEAARQKGTSLEDAIRGLQPSSDEPLDAFFERLQQNLREGQLRIIFFLEESPTELRSVVDFLNKQMERSEVLLVEARQYSRDGTRIVVPRLFGYTEQARQVKRSVVVTTAATRKRWDRASFFADALAKLDASGARVLESLYDVCLSLGCEIGWGTGAVNGTYTVRDLKAGLPSLLSVYSNGMLTLNFGALNADSAAAARERWKDLLANHVGLQIPDDYAAKYPSYRIQEWGSKARLLSDALEQLISETRGRSA